MKVIYRLIIGIAMLTVAGLVLAACDPTASATPAKKSQAQKASDAANSITFSENAEIDNIKKRLELTSNPGALGFIVLFNQAGQPVIYESVVGKVTSGGKRLTAPVQLWSIDRGQFGGSELGPAPSDEGTWGSSSDYIYYWNSEGAYRQWGADSYFYSDQPIRLRVEPLVINVAPAAEPAKQ